MKTRGTWVFGSFRPLAFLKSPLLRSIRIGGGTHLVPDTPVQTPAGAPGPKTVKDLRGLLIMAEAARQAGVTVRVVHDLHCDELVVDGTTTLVPWFTQWGKAHINDYYRIRDEVNAIPDEDIRPKADEVLHAWDQAGQTGKPC